MAAARSPTCAAIPDDVWSQGHLCPKGTSLGHLHTDPDRLRLPMVRDPQRPPPGGVVGRRLCRSRTGAAAGARRATAPAAVTVYVGNPVAHNLALSTHIGALIGMAQAAGMPAYYSPGTVDQWPLNLVSALLFGDMWNAPIPTSIAPTTSMILGANPSASQGSHAVRARPHGRGSPRSASAAERVIVVDPRRTHTAQRATRVGADQAGHRRAAAVRDPSHARRTRLDPASGTPRRSHHRTRRRDCDGSGLRPGGRRRRRAASTRRRIRALTHGPRRTPRVPCCTAGSAPRTQEFGTLATWLVFVINAALGRLDRAGGAVFPQARHPGRRCS